MSTDERRSARANVILTATIEQGKARIPVRVSNLSEHGALVFGNGLPESETQITFRCNGVAVQGWVSWAQTTRAGIQFGVPTSPEALSKREATPRTVISKDTREPNFRRPGFRGNQLTDEERKIVEEWNRPQTKRSEEAGRSFDS
jgi:hypothetical protein